MHFAQESGIYVQDDLRETGDLSEGYSFDDDLSNLAVFPFWVILMWKAETALKSAEEPPSKRLYTYKFLTSTVCQPVLQTEPTASETEIGFDFI